MHRKNLTNILLILLCLSNTAAAQLALKPLQNNTVVSSYLQSHPDYQWGQTNRAIQWGKDDTLKIPFFEDFTSTTIYPDSSKWRDNQVFINSDFPINPPSFGVATFDYLNAQGKPYGPLEKIGVRGGDTLTSQAINLADSSGVAYGIKDSFFFSFFYQCRGRGDLITDVDSLRLEFLDKNGKWNLVWSKAGDQIIPFRQVKVPLLNTKYLHNAFQFRLLNMTHQWGNNNHWHVDYIYLNKNRSAANLGYNDYAIQSKPTSLLKRYASIPYDHFLADTTEAADTIYFNVSNQSLTDINAQVIHIEWSKNDTLVRTVFGSNDNNVQALNWAQRKVSKYKFNTLSGMPVVIEREYHVKESGVINPVLFQGNDKIKVQQVFERYYAYDDGTAESGFGFNDLKDNDGAVAVRFDLKKSDTLRAVGMHLTHNINDVSKQRFVLQIWGDILFNGGADLLLYEKEWVSDSLRKVSQINGFFQLPLDSAIVLPKGKFYVGWSQDRDYNLGVGFDKNNGYLAGNNGANKNIYFNVGSGWIQNSNNALAGAPMIRPILGSFAPWSVSVEPNPIMPVSLSIYPNPTTALLHLPQGIQSFRVISTNGQVLENIRRVGQTIDVSHLQEGVYFIYLVQEDGYHKTLRFVKLAN